MATQETTLLLTMKADLKNYNDSVLAAIKLTERFQKSAVRNLGKVEKATKGFKTTTAKSFSDASKSAKKFNRNAKSAFDGASKSAKAFNKNARFAFNGVNKNINQTTNSMFNFSTVAKSVIAALGANQFITFADDIQKADNQLKAITSSAEEFNDIQVKLNGIANETRQSVTELTSVYARFARAGKEAGFTQEENLMLTESLTKAFKIEGNTTAEVNSTLLQLTQSFRSGRIQGEEFRAVSESSTMVLEALALQMGVNVGELKKLASEGKITARTLVDGLAKSAEKIDKEFSKLAPTFAEVGTAMGNSMVRGFNDSSLPSYLDTIKRTLVDVFTPDTEGDLVKKINDAQKEIKALAAEGDGFFTDNSEEIEGLEANVRSLTLALGEMRQARIDAASVESVKEEKASAEKEIEAAFAKIEAEQTYKDAVTAIRNDANLDEGQRLALLVGANKAALDQKLIDEREFHEAQAALSAEFSEGGLGSVKNEERIIAEEDFIARMAELNEMKIETAQEQADFELEVQNALLATKLTNEEQYGLAVLDIAQRTAASKDKLAKDEIKRDKKQLASARSYISAARTLAGAFAKDNEVLNASLIIADTAAAIMASLKINPYDYANVAVLGATGLAQLANVGGGGSIDSGAAATTGVGNGSDFSPETSTQQVSVTDSGEGVLSSSVQQISFASDGGSAAEQFLAESLNEGVRRGSISVDGAAN